MDYLSSFRVPVSKLPEAKNWEVGAKHKVLAEVELTGINKERDWSGEEDMPVSDTGRKGKKKEPKYRTMLEFKVKDVSAGPKDKALKSKMK